MGWLAVRGQGHCDSENSPETREQVGRSDPDPPQAHVQASAPLGGAFANEERRLR